jgi:predicted Zn finger-like uncharacterized protein
MLITACTDCGARFRVTPEQLNLRQGAVKCGSCGHVFNGFETLEQIPDEQFASYRAGISDPGPQAGPGEAAEDRGEPAADDNTSAGLESAEVAESVQPLDPAFEAGIERHDAARAGEEDEQGGLSPRGSPEPLPQSYELPAPSPRPRPSRLWGFGALLLFISLAALGVFEYRAALATRYPDLRPALQAACERIGCTVPWQNDELAVKLEDSELLEVPGQPGLITLSTRIRNLSDHPQEFPQLQLTLTDIDGQASVRRVFAPADYLGRALKAGDVMPARGDTLVSLRLEARRVKPTGYELLLFYP